MVVLIVFLVDFKPDRPDLFIENSLDLPSISGEGTAFALLCRSHDSETKQAGLGFDWEAALELVSFFLLGGIVESVLKVLPKRQGRSSQNFTVPRIKSISRQVRQLCRRFLGDECTCGHVPGF